MSGSLPSFEAAFSQSETYNFPGLQAVRLRATISKRSAGLPQIKIVAGM